MGMSFALIFVPNQQRNYPRSWGVLGVLVTPGLPRVLVVLGLHGRIPDRLTTRRRRGWGPGGGGLRNGLRQRELGTIPQTAV